MSNRGLRIFLLAFSALWFGVVVPGHQRGVIRIASASTAQPDDKSLPPCHRKKAPKPDKPTPLRPVCVICLFAATLTPPAPPVLNPAPLEFAHSTFILPVAEPTGHRIAIPLHERAPPQA